MFARGDLLAGRHRVERRLGTGGTASVLLAEDGMLARKVAIKVLHPSAQSDAGRRIRREARIGATLVHPNLVAVYDVLVEDDVVLLVLEYVPGETLADLLERGPLAVAEALAVLRPVADALDHVHAHGIVHRDVKPANVLLREDGGVKLADLGMATADDVSRITQTGAVLGTLAYMAPEQFEEAPVTPATDVFALAAMAFEVLSGRRARGGTTTAELLAAATTAPVPDLAAVRPGTPRRAADVLARGMARDPAERPVLARSLVDELAAALQAPDPPRTRPVPAPAGEALATPVSAPAASAPSALPPAPGAAEPPAPGTPKSSARLEPEPPARGARQPPAPARPRRRRRRAALLAPVALVLALGGVGTALVVGAGGDAPGGQEASVPQDAEPPASRPEPQPEPEAEPEPESEAPEPASGGTARPAAAVRSLYRRAASDDLDAAWSLASPALRAQLGGRRTFDATFATLESISFPRLAVTDRSGSTATVALRTVARHTTFTDRCTGTARTVRTGGRWLVDRLGVQCRRASG